VASGEEQERFRRRHRRRRERDACPKEANGQRRKKAAAVKKGFDQDGVFEPRTVPVHRLCLVTRASVRRREADALTDLSASGSSSRVSRDVSPFLP
jgi:hypothetical protein